MENSSLSSCAIIVVTNNSEKHIHKAMACIRDQTHPAERIILVDTGSADPAYLDRYRQQSNVEIILAEKDSGFCRGNNIGMQALPKQCDYVFFLNPDAFLTPSAVEQAVDFMEANACCGALSGMLLGYDIAKDQPTGKYDSTGIFRSWYGKWYDRHQGQTYNKELCSIPEFLPAICGAFFFCRKKALDTVLLRQGEVFDNTFYMYKEDIDLSIRLRRQGWKLVFLPDLKAYHCRGWQKDRSKMLRRFRLCSARNELRIQWHSKAPLPCMYSLAKYVAVKLINM